MANCRLAVSICKVFTSIFHISSLKPENQPRARAARERESVRAAVPADVPRLLALERGSATIAHWSEDEYRRLFENSTPERIVLVVDIDGRIQGFLVARIVNTECELENIVVEQSARRKQLGTRLLVELIERAKARGVEPIFLEVRASNYAARSFYEAHGFQQSGLRKRYYVAPVEDAVVYRLKT